ncbi:MAG TPA: DMT family transporter [Burkholderiaceae bacterium]|nr:DMT family transporter [Burkholderiaceae bacterium]
MSFHLSVRTAVLMTLPPLLWAGNAVVGRLVVGQVPPMALNLMRWTLAALLLAPLAWRVLRDRATLLRSWPYLLAVGTFGVGLFNALQYLALITSTALNVTLISASMPVWMLVVGMLGFGEHPSARQLLGATLSIAGVLVVVLRGSLAAASDLHFVAGDGYMLLGVVGWALYSWLLARPPQRLRPPPPGHWDWSQALLVQILFGLVAAGSCAGLEAALATHAPIAWSNPWIWAALAFVAVGPSLIAYRCWGLGVSTAGPALAAFFANLTPLIAALLSTWLLGESPQPYHALAFALIVAGIVVSVRRPR